MSLASSFRKQLFFVRLSTGEIDLLDGVAIERAVTFGTLNAETAVCELGSRVWLPLGLLGVMNLPTNALAPIRHRARPIVAPFPEGPCRVRDRPLPSFAARRAPIYATIVGGLLVVVLLIARLNSALADDSRSRTPNTKREPLVIAAQTFVPSTSAARTPKTPILTTGKRRHLHERDSRSKIHHVRRSKQ